MPLDTECEIGRVGIRSCHTGTREYSTKTLRAYSYSARVGTRWFDAPSNDCGSVLATRPREAFPNAQRPPKHRYCILTIDVTLITNIEARIAMKNRFESVAVPRIMAW